MTGEGKVALNELLKKFVDLKIEGAAKYLSGEYKGVLQKDLIEAVKVSTTCRDKIWEDLRKLLPLDLNQVEPSGKESAASPKGTDLLRSPRLGLEIWQHSAQNPMSFFDIDRDIIRVSINSAPFELRFPRQAEDIAVRICAWFNDSIFILEHGIRLADIPFFRAGTSMTITDYGSSILFLDNEAHNIFVDRMIEHYSDSQDRFLISWVGHNKRVTHLTKQTDAIFLVVLIDKDEDGILEVGEYEFMVLGF